MTKPDPTLPPAARSRGEDETRHRLHMKNRNGSRLADCPVCLDEVRSVLPASLDLGFNERSHAWYAALPAPYHMAATSKESALAALERLAADFVENARLGQQQRRLSG